MSYNKCFTKKDEKNVAFFGLLLLLLLSTLEINHCSQNNAHHLFTKLIDNFRIRITLLIINESAPSGVKISSIERSGELPELPPIFNASTFCFE